jgi:LemA protein
MMRIWAIAGVVGAGLLLGGCGINDVPTKGEFAKKTLADLQADYQRRADLIPNLVETVKGFAKQEQTVLVEVTEARAAATKVTLDVSTVTDPEKLKAFEEAQARLSGALGRLLAVSENYPDLKSNANFLALQSQLEGTENRINISRRDYNEAVRDFNLEFENIPDKWVQAIFHGSDKKMEMFQAAAGAEKSPTVKF